MTIFRAFLFSLLLFACHRKTEVEIGGIIVPVVLLNAADENHFDYTGNLSKSLKNDGQALEQLFRFCQKTAPSVARQHGKILLSVLEKIGDASFSNALARQSAEVAHPLWATLEAGTVQPIKEVAPLTWQVLLPKTAPQELRGLFQKHEKFDAYLDCAEPEKRYIAVDETGAIERNYKRLLHYPYPGQAIFAEVKGYKTDFFGSKTLPGNYAGFFIITEILELEAKNYRNTCIPYDFWALGTEPFWQAQISAGEGIIEFQTAEDDPAKIFPYAKPVQEDSTWVYASVSQNTGDNVRIAVRRDSCSDGMSDIIYNYQIKLTVNGKNFSGCGISFEEQQAEK